MTQKQIESKLANMIPASVRTPQMIAFVQTRFLLGCTCCEKRINFVEGLRVLVDKSHIDPKAPEERHISILCWECCKEYEVESSDY